MRGGRAGVGGEFSMGSVESEQPKAHEREQGGKFGRLQYTGETCAHAKFLD